MFARDMRCYCKRIFIYFLNFCLVFFVSVAIIFTIRRNSGSKEEKPDNSPSNESYWILKHAGIHVRHLQHDELLSYDSNAEHWTQERTLDLERFALDVKFRRSKQEFRKDLNRLLLKIKKIPRIFSSSCSEKVKQPQRDYKNETNLKVTSSWKRFYENIGPCRLYNKDHVSEMILKNLLNDTVHAQISAVKNMPGGTQVKLEVTFVNGHKAVMKPMRFDRKYETHPNHFYFSDFERHNAEIATFHLDKILGFRKALPTTGRMINLTDIWPKSEYNLSRLFFYSPAKNLCFVGTCKYYCDTTHAICGNPTMIESSFQVFLPSLSQRTKRLESPFARTYSKQKQKALWQEQPSFCDTTVKNSTNAQYLLEIVDVAILDFFTGNQDRHHLEFINEHANDPYFLHIDNGRAFGRSDFDDVDILAPLSQCCLIKPTTFATLMSFYNEPLKLLRTFAESMSQDPIAPILADKHLVAVERRLEIILQQVHFCIFVKNNAQYKNVIRSQVTKAG